MHTYATTNASGCDSGDLRFKRSVLYKPLVGAKQPVLWFGMVAYETSGLDIHHQNSQGCDSIAILDLTVGSTSSSYNFVNSCDVVTWNGMDYTASGNYEFFCL